MTFVSYTDTRASVCVCVCGVVSRPWQRQEIPRDVFNKIGQRQPESWQMKTCWSTPQNSNNTLPALAAGRKKKKKITVRVLVYKTTVRLLFACDRESESGCGCIFCRARDGKKEHGGSCLFTVEQQNKCPKCVRHVCEHALPLLLSSAAAVSFGPRGNSDVFTWPHTEH